METLDRIIKKVREDFIFIRDSCFAVLIFGSYARGENCLCSDIDVCIVLKERKIEGGILYNNIYENVKMDEYDVVIFESCDDSLKYEISKDYIIAYCDNPEELKKYLTQSLKYTPVKKTRKELLNELGAVINAA
ncbi:nucleotidyltransferase domain-containing protein [Methanomicrobium antiquum]|uniref:Nucleotidyltransferase domain-containing protein n=1 Tax=Methanomicrobium antiquum TaxID=487686 RepID=A0AAF0FZM5_9EURY|nr:nucleotidyltransferase domain-containing protein [Methanomicrobium antiquum]WFN37414.1 nucleotidyltransferase domain-containing protein [Methanomicrobium antiquum]